MIRAAVIGCGRMGAFTSDSVKRFSPACWLPLAHAEAIKAHPDLELVAMCDTDAANLERARAAHGSPAGYTDFRQLAAEVRPELTGIATRTIGRAEIIETLYSHGTRAFHVEKPLCNSVVELNLLEDILTRPGVFATYGTVRRFFAIYRAARDLVSSGRFGKLLEVRANFGPGALYWTQVHAIDLILFAAPGRTVTGVQARLDHLDRDDESREILNDPVVQSATIWFEDGVAGHIGRAPGVDLIMACERGEVTVASDGREILISEQRGDDPYLVCEVHEFAPHADAPQGSLAPISQLAACLAGDAWAMAENAQVAADILLGQRIAFAMVASHERGSGIVKLSDVDSMLRILAKSGQMYA